MVRPRAMLMLMLSLLGFAPGCDQRAQQNAGNTPTPAAALPAEHRFSIHIGTQPVQMRLAVHENERRRGLMQVKVMDEDEGMLFVWSAPQVMSFYMRNTLIPLDIGFFDRAGVLREIYPMYPHVEDPVVSKRSDLQFALEMNQGWFAARGIKPGARLNFEELRQALQQRGLNPDLFVPASAP